MKSLLKTVRRIFKKPDMKTLLDDISGVLDPMDFEVLVVRRQCEVLSAAYCT